MRPNGVVAPYSSTGDAKPKFFYDDRFRMNPVICPELVYAMSDAAKAHAHAGIAHWLKEAKPIVGIARRYDLSEAVQAHLAIEPGEKTAELCELTFACLERAIDQDVADELAYLPA